MRIYRGEGEKYFGFYGTFMKQNLILKDENIPIILMQINYYAFSLLLCTRYNNHKRAFLQFLEIYMLMLYFIFIFSEHNFIYFVWLFKYLKNFYIEAILKYLQWTKVQKLIFLHIFEHSMQLSDKKSSQRFFFFKS